MPTERCSSVGANYNLAKKFLQIFVIIVFLSHNIESEDSPKNNNCDVITSGMEWLRVPHMKLITNNYFYYIFFGFHIA